MDRKETVRNYFRGRDAERQLTGIIADGSNFTQTEDNADFIIVTTEGMFEKPADSFPEITWSRDLRKMLPLVDYDPFFDQITAHCKEIRKHYGEDSFIFYEISSPVSILWKHLYGSNEIKEIPEYLKKDPYSILLALDTICVDCLNSATRAILEGKMDGIYMNVFNNCIIDEQTYSRFFAPVEIHFLEEINILSRYNIIGIGNENNPVNRLDYYRDYPVSSFLIYDEKKQYDKREMEEISSNRKIFHSLETSAGKTVEIL